MKRKDFGFELPEELVAQTPITPRENARLMHYQRATKTIDHRHFFDLPSILRSGDVLVFNDSRVMKARLLGAKETGGAVEVFLLHPATEHYENVENALEWAALVRGKVREGTEITFSKQFSATVTTIRGDGTILITLSHPAVDIMEAIGHTPVPPYIAEEVDLPDYQTVYAKDAGSVAAPTAGLHFSNALLEELRGKGVEFAYVTLHVGAGTFLPVKMEDLSKHQMHSEYGQLTKQTAKQLNRAKIEGRRVIAVGTTATRTLETAASDGEINPFSGWTDIFITPGYKWNAIDGLITNFHLPYSTLIMLVSAFMGLEETKRAYDEAVGQSYRFYSFGDGMFIE